MTNTFQIFYESLNDKHIDSALLPDTYDDWVITPDGENSLSLSKNGQHFTFTRENFAFRFAFSSHNFNETKNLMANFLNAFLQDSGFEPSTDIKIYLPKDEHQTESSYDELCKTFRAYGFTVASLAESQAYIKKNNQPVIEQPSPPPTPGF